jgi:hypothetical protein
MTGRLLSSELVPKVKGYELVMHSNFLISDLIMCNVRYMCLEGVTAARPKERVREVLLCSVTYPANQKCFSLCSPSSYLSLV